MALRSKGVKLKPSGTVKVRLPAKAADAELLTSGHRAWAAEVRRRAGYRCQDCGAPGYEIDPQHGGRLYADHVVERRDGGARLDPANGRCLCARCHTTKTVAARAARHAAAPTQGVGG